MLKKEIENYESQRHSLTQFREKLKKFVDEICDKKPLVFIIDELDRCNPHYAVKVLERIKHLFNIPNIIFVLSIDKLQLSNSIRGYYGSDSIDADEYLKRFIDIEYMLPDPDVEKFCNYLYGYYDFTSFFNSKERKRFYKEDALRDYYLTMSIAIFKHKKVTLRQIEKIYANIRISLNMFEYSQNIHPDLLCLLTYLRICENDCYKEITHEHSSTQDLINHIENIFPKSLFNIKTTHNNFKNRLFYFTIALLLKCHATNLLGISESLLVTHAPDTKHKLTFEVKIADENLLIEALEYTEKGTNTIFPLSNIVNKINLLENIQNI